MLDMMIDHSRARKIFMRLANNTIHITHTYTHTTYVWMRHRSTATAQNQMNMNSMLSTFCAETSPHAVVDIHIFN